MRIRPGARARAAAARSGRYRRRPTRRTRAAGATCATGHQRVGELVQHRVGDEDQRGSAASRARRARPGRGRGDAARVHRARMYAGFRRSPVPSARDVRSRSAASRTRRTRSSPSRSVPTRSASYFAPGSPRQVTPDDRRARSSTACPPGVVTVGVFRDEAKERVVEIVNTLGLGGAQLHGREPLSDVRWIRQRVPFVIQALRRRRPRARRGRQRPGRHRAGRRRRARVGHACSTGRSPTPCPPGCGCCSRAGSTARTSAQAIRRVRPWGVDVSQRGRDHAGLGRKDARKLRRFIEQRARGRRRSSAATAGCPDPRGRARTTGWPTARELRTAMTR